MARSTLQFQMDRRAQLHVRRLCLEIVHVAKLIPHAVANNASVFERVCRGGDVGSPVDSKDTVPRLLKELVEVVCSSI